MRFKRKGYMKYLLFYGVKIFLMLSMFLCPGCTFYIFDPQYYKAKKYSKQYSATYIIDRNLYDEIIQKKDSKENNHRKLTLQEKLLTQIKYSKNEEWIQKKSYYMELARKHSGYYNDNNAKTLFVLDKLHELDTDKQILSNGRPYYIGAYSYNGEIKIPEYLREKIGGATNNSMKFQQIIYPQFFYIDEMQQVKLISVGVIYRYVNINKVYGLKEDDNIDSMFANGEWIYLRKNKIKYLDGKQ